MNGKFGGQCPPRGLSVGQAQPQIFPDLQKQRASGDYAGKVGRPHSEPHYVSVDMHNVTKLQAAPDPFDPESLRLVQSFVETSGVKKLLTTVPVRKPNPQDFVRVHPDEGYRLTSAIIELKEDRETYLVQPHIAHQLPGECSPVILYTTINRQSVVFLWPVRLPTPDGRINEWHRSASEAAERAIGCWIRVKADMALGAYAQFEASSTIPDPIWPMASFKELLKVGFRDRLVDSIDHPVIKRLRGEN